MKLGKPFYDLMIDDRAINADLWRSKLNLKTCLVTGVFELLDADLCTQLQRLRKRYNNIVAAIQSDPILDDENAESPKTSLEDRITMLKSMLNIDEVVVFRIKSDIKPIASQVRAEVVETAGQEEEVII